MSIIEIDSDHLERNPHLVDVQRSVECIDNIFDASILINQLLTQLSVDDAQQLRSNIYHSILNNNTIFIQPHTNLSTPSKHTRHHKSDCSVLSDVWDRFYVLAGLLLLQSFSSLILSSFSELIDKHIVITLYLTMLVGAGGNSSSQAAVHMIRLIALNDKSVQHSSIDVIVRESLVAAALGILMMWLGFMRVLIFGESIHTSFTMSLSLFCIVLIGVIAGTSVPLLLHKQLNIDPAHSSPICQVLMDVGGVIITCYICQAMLSDPVIIPAITIIDK